MLCKKCNTAVDESAGVCGYCGAKARKRNNGMLGFVWVALLMAAGGALVTVERMKESQVVIMEPVKIEAATPIESEKPAANTNKQEVAAAESPKEIAQREDGAVWKMVQSAAIAANGYYASNRKDSTLVSKNGYFYNTDAGDYVHPGELSRWGLNSRYADERILLLYMRPSDLNQYTELSAEQGQDLGLFAAYETKDGFAVASSRGQIGIISRERLQELLESYSTQHGEAIRPERSSVDFYGAVAALRNYQGTGEEYDVRLFLHDAKYGVIVFSARTTPELPEMYVLKREGSGWQVVLGGLENETNLASIINRHLADFNLDMLPKYSLPARRAEIRSNFTEMLEVLSEHGITEESDGRAVFITGTDEFCYAEFESGKRLLGIFTADRGWVMYPVESFAAGEKLMRDFSSDPPYFLIKQ